MIGRHSIWIIPGRCAIQLDYMTYTNKFILAGALTARRKRKPQNIQAINEWSLCI